MTLLRSSKPYLFSLSFAVASSAAPVLASNSTINLGPSMTTGPTSISASIGSGFANPGMLPLMIDEDEEVRMSYLPSFGFNVELGAVDNFEDDINDLIDLLEDSSGVQSPSETLERFNRVLKDIGEEGYIKFNTALNLPFLPVLYRSNWLGGTLGFSVDSGAQVAALVLDDSLRIAGFNGKFDTNTALYLKSGIEKKATVSYGRQILANHPMLEERGSLYAGVKVKLIQMELSKQVIPLSSLNGKDLSDVISDTYDQNLSKSTNIALDVGVVWDADQYRVGLTLENINSPSFDYGKVGVNCIEQGENSIARDQCETASFFVNRGEISAKESHKKHALMRVDGLYQITDSWAVSGSYDLAKYNDMTGFDNQWLHLATSFDPNSTFIPAIRLGYKKNLAGSELSSAMLGMTLFKLVSLDFEYGLESVDVDGSSAPRRFGFSLSLEESF